MLASSGRDRSSSVLPREPEGIRHLDRPANAPWPSRVYSGCGASRALRVLDLPGRGLGVRLMETPNMNKGN